MKKSANKPVLCVSTQIREVLLEGPATAREVSYQLQHPYQKVVKLIAALGGAGHVEAIGNVKAPDCGSRAPQRLYRLTPIGRHYAKHDPGKPKKITRCSKCGAWRGVITTDYSRAFKPEGM